MPSVDLLFEPFEIPNLTLKNRIIMPSMTRRAAGGVGRMLIADPDWPKKIRAGRHEELTPFTREALAMLV